MHREGRARIADLAAGGECRVQRDRVVAGRIAGERVLHQEGLEGLVRDESADWQVRDDRQAAIAWRDRLLDGDLPDTGDTFRGVERERCRR